MISFEKIKPIITPVAKTLEKNSGTLFQKTHELTDLNNTKQ